MTRVSVTQSLAVLQTAATNKQKDRQSQARLDSRERPCGLGAKYSTAGYQVFVLRKLRVFLRCYR